jgi:HK97 family phage major capsid protein
MELKDIAAKIDELEGKAKTLTEQADKSDSADDIKAIQDTVEKEITPQLASLTKERDERLRDIEFKSMQSTMGTLEDAINDLRSGFPVGSTNAGKGVGAGNESPYGDGTHSYFADVKAANKGRTQAFERLTKGIEGLNDEGKAMTEGTGSQGGYLVQTQIERQILDVRELDNVLRDLCSKLNVTTTTIELDQITLGTTAGWVAELATKPESTSLTLATVTATVFTAAGLATISNQLLADSNPAVDGLVTRDLAKRLVALEETAFLAGSGTGQPLGILNTPGVNTSTAHVTSGSVVSASGGILDAVLDAIFNTQRDYGNPTGILMHPRTWTAILKDKNANGVYTYGSPANATNASPDISQSRTVYQGPTRTLWGVPVVLSNRVPTNLGAGTNESRIIVGDFTEALILDRQGITVDESPHVYFTSNQTVFRAEERVGFTAARQPKAFCVVGGDALANS